jgi:hypothetical protein
VISDITNKARGTYGVVISEINEQATHFQCNFSFEGRVVNYEAHSLARFSVSRGPGCHVWLGNPHDSRCIPHHVDFDDE